MLRPPDVEAGNVPHPPRGPVQADNLLGSSSCDEHLLVPLVRYGAGIAVEIQPLKFRDTDTSQPVTYEASCFSLKLVTDPVTT